jgi:uncharacterized protein
VSFNPDLRKIESDLFVIPYGKRYILYAPLRRAAALVNKEAVNSLCQYLKTGEKHSDREIEKVLSNLESSGILRSSYERPTYPADYKFAPHEVTLFPTTNCNLRCVYCYASAGIKNYRMGWETAKAAVDVIFTNAKKVGAKGCIIGFHGGGEPALEWGLIRRTVEYAEELAEQQNLELRIHMATNGILSSQKREYIIDHFSSVNVSLDGPPDIHDTQRPQANGRNSYSEILDSLKHFDACSFSYGIRPTITEKSVARMPEMVDFFYETLKLTYLHFEPLFYCGRCLTTKWNAPNPKVFVKYFRQAHQKAKKRRVEVYYSGARVDVITSKFCAAAGDGFSVTPRGRVTSCFEVCDEEDSRSEIFHFGYFDSASKHFVFEEEKLQKLRHLHVENFPFCEDCFCKWHCAGDCLAKVLPHGEPVKHAGSDRCQINRSLSMMQIIELLNNKKGGVKDVSKGSKR